MNKVDGDNQSGFAGNFADKKVTVSVLNQFGGATEGVPVTFSVAGGGGTIASDCRDHRPQRHGAAGLVALRPGWPAARYRHRGRGDSGDVHG